MPDAIPNEVETPRTPPVSVSSESTAANRTGSWKYLTPAYHDRIAPCSHGCPTAVDVQGYMTMLREGRIADACELILRENPMPAITGRVCDHPCEARCNRSTFDGAVAIHAVERMLGDAILAGPRPKPPAALCNRPVAVVGSGPAGLACAYHLVQLGYRVEVFEQENRPGGMLRVGIPKYRLPRSVLDAQIEYLRALGIRIHCGFRVGRDIRWSALTREFGALFIATGAHISRTAGFDASSMHGVWTGLEFLKLVNNGGQPRIGEHAVVIGGGNTAIDCARTALRLGARATVVYRRTRAEMPAIADEVTDAEREGVAFEFLAAPVEPIAPAQPFQLHCDRMVLGEPAADGRRAPLRSGEPPFVIEADTIIVAIGEDSDLDMTLAGCATRVDEWGATQIANIFIGGDCGGDDRTVAHALGAGKRAAVGIDRYLRKAGGEHLVADRFASLRMAGTGAVSMVRWTGDDPVKRVAPHDDVVRLEEINFNHFARVPRTSDERALDATILTESNLGISTDSALFESTRCLQCGVCNECELCQIFCSDAAIRRSTYGSRFEIMLDQCKGCGICAAECPRGAIVMTREGV